MNIDTNGTYEEIENEILATEGLATLPDATVDALASLDGEASLAATGYITEVTESIDEENPYEEVDALGCALCLTTCQL